MHPYQKESPVDPTVFEKIGQFYLGRPWDREKRELAEGVTLYDSKDLTTHAVCVGMTGSGKTGLCVGLLEEAAIDGIPALVVDPKGDLTNMLLQFPDLAPGDFEPWVDPDEARRRDMSVSEYAASQAELWRSGLAKWGEDGARIARLKESAEFMVFTPGSSAGLPISILGSFAAPPPEIRDDAELVADRVESTVTSLLALLDIDADPLQSREHILLSTVLSGAWARGLDLDLESLIHRIQNPAVDRIGVMELESFFPAKDRFKLAMALNNLLAAPGFQTWLQGMPLDPGRLLYSPSGRPRISVLSIAHLSDAERMFFVSLLLNETLGWMRGQSGTSSLRAILYIDEIFGFMPPVAEPPSKKPLLTMLKQARAFGLGCVLATQNPVDLDYKGLSNAGTWFIGRLQTERDQLRLLAGLEGAAAESGASFDSREIREILAGLGKRVFLLHNVHEDTPELFHTRWVLSYLRGPMTRDQVRRLTELELAARPTAEELGGAAGGGDGVGASGEGGQDVVASHPPTAVGADGGSGGAAADSGHAPSRRQSSAATSGRPVLPPDVPQVFVRPRTDVDGSTVRYVPALLGLANIEYQDKRRGLRHRDQVSLISVLTPAQTEVDWSEGRPFAVDEGQLETEPLPGAAFGPLPALAGNAKPYPEWERDLRNHLYRNRSLVLLESDRLDEVSRPGESERDFRVRIAERLREHRDEAVDALRRKYAARITRAEDAVDRAEAAVDTQADQAQRARMDMAVSVGEGLISALVGGRRRRSFRSAGSAARRMSRSNKEAADVDRAREALRKKEHRLADLETELRDEIDELRMSLDPSVANLKTATIQPRQRDVDVRRVTLAWVPVKRG